MIYFIRCGSRRLVKIGYCSTHPRARLASLQTGNPETLFLLGMTPGEKGDEAAWHSRFAHLRTTGEWFKLTAELREAMKPYRCEMFSKKERAALEAEGHRVPDDRRRRKAYLNALRRY